ncbi:Synaptic vesicle transporter [Teratosphaeria destructans]|uniref:Synaptic vesicle transporter n=1 Tax=Teratosphaeria destructans TaxID=418781 RepID=A0A9W7SSL4_9PEZI|nr:Synaptic vesicle transporter [Teratosphaeria destructans]
MPRERKHDKLVEDAELDTAMWTAARGALVGAAKWGAFSAVAAGLGSAFSPVYRGLTFQFKVFLQMSGMTFGSVVEADRRLRQAGAAARQQKARARDAEVWRRYEEDYLEKEAEARLRREAAASGSPQDRS